MLPDRISRLLTAYVDGEVDADQRKAVLRVLRRSAEARELLRDLQRDADGLRDLPRPALGQDFAQQVLQIIASRKAESARRSALAVGSYVPSWLGLATAAAVLLVVGLGSYLYFAAANQQGQAEPLAIRNPEPEGLAFPQAAVESQPSTSPAPAPSPREVLSSPAPATEPKTSPSTVLASAGEGKPQAETKQTELVGSPLREEIMPFQDPDVGIALIFHLRDVEQEKRKQQLQQGLQKAAAHRMDLRCVDTLVGMERLQTACKSQGIQFVINQDAQAVLKLGMKANTSFALYLEDVTAEEIIAVLQQLSSEDRKAETRRRGSGQFDSLVVNAMTRDDQQKLARLLGIDAAQLEAPKPKGEGGVDIRKPISAITEEQVLQFLKGQGAPRTEPGKPASKTPERQALVVAYTPGRPRPASAELKHFLDNRKERRAGTVQILLVLRPAKS